MIILYEAVKKVEAIDKKKQETAQHLRQRFPDVVSMEAFVKNGGERINYWEEPSVLEVMEAIEDNAILMTDAGIHLFKVSRTEAIKKYHAYRQSRSKHKLGEANREDEECEND